MTMKSLSQMPRLLELPENQGKGPRSTREHLNALANMDRGMYAAEQATAVAIGFWTVFDTVNVDDTVLKAYQAQYPNLAEENSLHEHWMEMMDRGEGSMTGFISGVKGKVAEFNVADQLRDAGWTGVEVTPNPTQPIFDITATPPDWTLRILSGISEGICNTMVQSGGEFLSMVSIKVLANWSA